MNKKRDKKLAKLLGKKRWNKKDVERINRLLAEIESAARSASEERQEKIKVLWDLDEQQLKAAKKPNERKHIEQKLKEQKLEKLLNWIKDLRENNALADQVGELVDLVELAGLQDSEIEYLTPFRRELEELRDYNREQLEALSFARVIKLSALPGFGEPLAEEERKKVCERKRSRLHRDFRNSIEYQFGGGAEDEWRKLMLQFLPALWLDHPIYKAPPPTCLDKIFAGGSDSMLKLEELFWMERHRFPKELPYRREDRKIVYDWEAVVHIMDFLLREKRDFLLNEKRRKHKPPVRGTPKKLWLYDEKDPDLQLRVLRGIEVRIKSPSVPEQIKPRIKAKFLVIHRYLPDSGKK